MKTYVLTLEWNNGAYSERDFPHYNVSAYGLVSDVVRERIKCELERFSHYDNCDFDEFIEEESYLSHLSYLEKHGAQIEYCVPPKIEQVFRGLHSR
jgi:hypothetical protein